MLDGSILIGQEILDGSMPSSTQDHDGEESFSCHLKQEVDSKVPLNTLGTQCRVGAQLAC